MPIRDRKFYIKKHNGDVQIENNKTQNTNKTNDPSFINKLAETNQLAEKNTRERN